MIIFDEEAKKYLEEFIVDLNGEDVSDIIEIVDSLSFESDYHMTCHNHTTGKTGDFKDVIRKDKRFILFDETMRKNGIYVKVCEEYDAVIIIECSLLKQRDGVFKWYEINRTLYSQSKYIRTLRLPSARSYIDICGQTIGNNGRNVIPVGMRKTLLSYFGGPVHVINDYGRVAIEHSLFMFHDMSELDELQTLYQIIIGGDTSWSIKPGIIRYEEAGQLEKLGDIPVYAKDALKQYIKKNKLAILEELKDGKNFLLKGNVIILQKHGKEYVARFFAPSVSASYPIEESKVELVECKQMFLSWENIDKYELRSRDCSDGFLIWRDEKEKGSSLEYGMWLVDGVIDCLKSSKDMNAADEKIYELYGTFYSKQCLAKSINIAKNDILQMLFSVKGISKRCKNSLLSNIGLTDASAVNYINKAFGSFNPNKKKLDKIFGVPKGIIKYALCSDSIYTIRIMKTIFGNHTDYLANMNFNDCKELYDSIRLNNEKDNLILKSLVDLKGQYNWKGYIRQCERLKDDERYKDIYVAYLNMLSELDEEVQRKAEWKLYGNALEKSYESVFSSYCMLKDLTEYAEAAKMFKERADICEQYAYHNNDYTILWPKSPSELLKEGIFLQHCVKEFIDAVAKGKTTILFIRKNYNLQKPYFTLEVRDGIVRQCLGIQNCTILSQPESLKRFLKSFCDNKGIVYSDGCRAIGV